MRVNKLFQKLALDPKLRSTRFRGTVISTLTSYYQFLVSMYLPKSQIAYPPEDGWPNVTKELYLAEYSPRKTDEVIRLARHLPYVQGDDEFDEFPEIYPTVFCSGRTGHWPAVAELPPSVFCFAEPRDGEGYYFFLDVEQETIVIYGSDSAFKGRPNSPYKPLETTVSSPVSCALLIRAQLFLSPNPEIRRKSRGKDAKKAKDQTGAKNRLTASQTSFRNSNVNFANLWSYVSHINRLSKFREGYTNMYKATVGTWLTGRNRNVRGEGYPYEAWLAFKQLRQDCMYGRTQGVRGRTGV